MFDTLIASRPVSWRGRYVSAGSLTTVVHGAIVVSLAVATVRARPPAVMPMDTTMVFIAPESRTTTPKPPLEERAVETRILIASGAMRGFQTIAALAEIPTTLPPVNLAERFDPRDYSGTGVEGGTAEGAVVDPALVRTAQVVYAAAVTEEPPELLHAPPLGYPPLLRQAGVEGTVMLEFVVDTVGRVERASVHIVSCPHVGFEPAALEVARQAVFRPARVGGRAVRVLVRMPVNFSLRRVGA
jgi:protein TonB